MHPDLSAALSHLDADLRSGAVDRAALFWLKVFADEALAAGGALRSDRWIEAGLAAAQHVPGLQAAHLAPRQHLAAGYGLFHFVRLKDGAGFSREALWSLDWQRRYQVSLAPDFAADLPELAEWVEARWSRLGGVDPQYAALEEVIARYAGASPHPQPLSYLLEILHEAQDIFGGWLPRPAVERIAAALNMPQADVYGVTEFYDLFHTEPVGRKVIRVCQDAPCGVAGADALLAGLCRHLHIQPGETTADGRYTVEAVRCLGCATGRRPRWSTRSAMRRPGPTPRPPCSWGRRPHRGRASAAWSRSRWPTSAWSIPPAWRTTAPKAGWPRCAKRCGR
jgi:NADH-quinone oxidoreductase subunit E